MDSPGAPQRVLIVEDHALLASSLALALRAEGFTVEAVTPTAAADPVERAARLRPDVVLLDLDLGQAGSGLDILAALRGTGAEVVVVTGCEDRGIWGDCLEAGALGVVCKCRPFEELVDHVVQAARHTKAMTEQERCDALLAARRRRKEQAEHDRCFAGLTPSEQRVLLGLCAGHHAADLAREAGVTEATVRSQIRAILSKLGVHSQLEAVSLARRAGWSPYDAGTHGRGSGVDGGAARRAGGAAGGAAASPVRPPRPRAT